MRSLLKLDSTEDDNLVPPSTWRKVMFRDESTTLFLTRKQWEREGQPTEVTVTVESGNRLRR